ncbi:hypothetical protein [Aquimarina aquimarini]|uniref:hypothetical protein n=1 Tax=Aquimarina aquimarini TaxID=1191734 RepID=UPI000D54FF4D|nr:hypothetical protein [Aquimarina aquimarini]
MILGTLSLFQKRGIFYREIQLNAQDRFATMIEQQLSPDPMVEDSLDIATQYRVTPVEESGDTDYITATFEDHGKAQYPYQVTVWVLIEEAPSKIVADSKVS